MRGIDKEKSGGEDIFGQAGGYNEIPAWAALLKQQHNPQLQRGRLSLTSSLFSGRDLASS